MNRLLIVGGSEKQLPIIIRAKELGYYIICIDGNPNSIGYKYADECCTIDINDYKACLDYAISKKIDGVTTLSSTATLPTVNYIAENMNLPGNPFSISQGLKSKYWIKQVLLDNELNVLGDFFEIQSIEELDSIKNKLIYPVVCKPSDGSASKGVIVIKNEDELIKSVEYSLSCSRISKVYIERFIDGIEYSAESFVYKGNPIVLGIVKTTLIKENNGLLNYGHSVPSDLSFDLSELVKKQVVCAIKALGIINGSVNMDIIISDNTPYIIDVGPRMGLNLIGTHIIPYSTGFNVLDSTIKVACNEEVDTCIKETIPIATRLLIMEPGIIREIKPMDDLIGNHNILDIVLKVKPGDIIKPYENKSDTCGWVICNGKNEKEANFNAEKAKKIIDSRFVIK